MRVGRPAEHHVGLSRVRIRRGRIQFVERFRADDSERAFGRSAISGDRVSDEDLAHAIQLLRSSEAIADTVERARQYARRAVDALARFPASKVKSALIEAVEFAVARAY